MGPRTLISRIINDSLAPLHLRITGVHANKRTEALFPRNGCKQYAQDGSKGIGQIEQLVLLRGGIPTERFTLAEPITLNVTFVVHQEIQSELVIILEDDFDRNHVSATDSTMISDWPSNWCPGKYLAQIVFPSGILNVGRYYVRASLNRIDVHLRDGLSFEIVGEVNHQPDHGLLAVMPEYKLSSLDGMNHG